MELAAQVYIKKGLHIGGKRMNMHHLPLTPKDARKFVCDLLNRTLVTL